MKEKKVKSVLSFPKGDERVWHQVPTVEYASCEGRRTFSRRYLPTPSLSEIEGEPSEDDN